MKLTRESTALDLSKLTEGELKDVELQSGIKNDCEKYIYLCRDKEFGYYYLSSGYEDGGLTLVDFQTFKSIHFPEPEADKPTYEDLTDTLQRCVWLLNRLDVPSSLVEDYGNILMNSEAILSRAKQ